MSDGIVFVFGSNLDGRHGKGAALDAVKYWGAERGNAVGRQGDSYAIPTKDHRLRPLEVWRIAGQAADFLAYARQHPELDFQVTAVGCGLAGYTDAKIAPLFRNASPNVHLPLAWKSGSPAPRTRTPEDEA